MYSVIVEKLKRHKENWTCIHESETSHLLFSWTQECLHSPNKNQIHTHQMSLTLSELNIKSKQKICCFKSSLKQSPFTSSSSSKTCISFSDSRSNYQNNRFTYAVRNCAYCICTENICYPICSTISLAFVMMLAPV